MGIPNTFDRFRDDPAIVEGGLSWDHDLAEDGEAQEWPEKKRQRVAALQKDRKEVLSICLAHASLCDNTRLITQLFTAGVEPSLELFALIARSGQLTPLPLMNACRVAFYRQTADLAGVDRAFAVRSMDCEYYFNYKWFEMKEIGNWLYGLNADMSDLQSWITAVSRFIPR